MAGGAAVRMGVRDAAYLGGLVATVALSWGARDARLAVVEEQVREARAEIAQVREDVAAIRTALRYVQRGRP